MLLKIFCHLTYFVIIFSYLIDQNNNSFIVLNRNELKNEIKAKNGVISFENYVDSNFEENGK